MIVSSGCTHRHLLIALTLNLVTKAEAQGDPERTVVVVVSVSSATGTPIEGVNLAVSRSGLGAFLYNRTDKAGIAVFHVPRSPIRHDILARRLGWLPIERRLEFTQSDSLQLTLQLERTATELNAVVVEAPRSNYRLDASQIAASRRPVRDALEVLQKLKPSMLYDRDRCKGEVVENVWINGRRVLFMARNVPILGGRSGRTIGTMRVRTPGGSNSEPPAVDSVLASIRSEHVQEIRLVNCWDTSVPGVGANNALYVALKPGVDWDWKRGSFVPDSLIRTRQ